MRNTKVYSITMPPELARQAERLAKKEHRTMSELMREALRRYQQPQVFFDPTQFVKREVAIPPALKAIREDARQKGTDRLTMAQINREVTAVRRPKKKKTNHTSK